jgi:hypothetical protein
MLIELLFCKKSYFMVVITATYLPAWYFSAKLDTGICYIHVFMIFLVVIFEQIYSYVIYPLVNLFSFSVIYCFILYFSVVLIVGIEKLMSKYPGALIVMTVVVVFVIVYISCRCCVNCESVNNLEGGLGPYLAGLIESDGNIYVPTTARSLTTGKVNYPAISIVFPVSDIPLAEKLVEVIGHGYITVGTDKNYCILSIQNTTGVQQVINIINGYMRTPKYDKLCQLYTWYSSLGLNPGILLPLDNSPILDNAWLAGFAEGDGSFLLHKANNSYFVGNFTLPQSRVDVELINRYKPIMDLIAAAFQVTSVNISTITNTSGTLTLKLIVKAGSLASSLIVCSYFDRFPLKGGKYLDYLNYRRLVQMQVSGQNKTPEGVNETMIIKQNHNRTRKVWTWVHLEEFYKLLIFCLCWVVHKLATRLF